jgi:predicted unusual protein kinase regulating ubiquinone biosynthesis (AarF/ABC1/UbiB family)
VNKINDNHDYFYIKLADASRIYGLELEHLLSPNVISYCTHEDTLVEEHIAGIPADQFMNNHLSDANFNPIRLSKEFIKFNERCFVRLLGDMHSSNFVIIVTPDFEDFHYRLRAIDFDQQSYESSKSVYMPQYFKQNYAMIQMGMKYLTAESVKQYQAEERTLIANRLREEKSRMHDLIDTMKKDTLSIRDNLESLKQDLARHYTNDNFLNCKSMGEVVELSLKLVLVH